MLLSTAVIPLLLNILLITCQQGDEENQEAEQQKAADMMKHDGVKRVIAATGKNMDKIMKKNDIVVMMFWIDNGKASEVLSDKDVYFLETIAQMFAGRKVAVATCEIVSNQEFVKSAEVTYTGMMKIFNRGRTTTYYGQRSADVLFPYLAKMMAPALHVVLTKADKKQYDANDLPKVIAYVNAKGKELQNLNNAALHFQPMIPFYVVHDSKLAKSFHLKKLNSLHLAKPYEKAVTYSSKNGITEESVVKFIKEHKQQRITKMRLENLHDVWAIDGKGFIVPVFASSKTEEGNKFFALAKSLAKNFVSNANLSFIWIDPNPFPGMVEYWSKSFKIDPSKPTIGVVDVHAQTSAWYPNPQEGGYVQNDLKRWINDVVNGKIELIPIAYKDDAPQMTSEEEEHINAAEDTESVEEDPTKEEL